MKDPRKGQRKKIRVPIQIGLNELIMESNEEPEECPECVDGKCACQEIEEEE